MQQVEQAQIALHDIQQMDVDLFKWCDNIQIDTVEQRHHSEELLASVKISLKRVEALEDNLLEPSYETIKRIKDLFRGYKDKLKSVKLILDSALSNRHKTELEITEGQALQRAQDYWEKRKEAEATGEVVPLPDLAVNPVPATSYHNMGSTNYRPHVKVSILKPALIPREYCTPSESLLRKAGEIALAQKKPMPLIEGAIIEVEYIPINRTIR